MAIKSTIFLLAIVLMNARLMVSSVEDVHKIETKYHRLHLHRHHRHYYHPADALIQAPTKAPTHAPEQALGHTHIQAPIKAPTHSPVKVPAHSPIKTPTNAPSHSPSKAPIHAPHKEPAHAPVFFTQGVVLQTVNHTASKLVPEGPA
ncbi:hypothetical protein OROGR_018325 [Orobanche gracilis]